MQSFSFRVSTLAAIFTWLAGTALLAQPSPQFYTARNVTPAGAVADTILTAGDLNGDGRPDLVSLAYSTTSTTLNIWLQNANGTFSSKSTSIAAYKGTTAKIVDMNGDGVPDIVLAIPVYDPSKNPEPMQIVVALGAGNGTFQALAPVNLSVPSSNHDNFQELHGCLLIADVNGDGHPDVIATDGTLNQPAGAILLNNGQGNLSPGPALPANTAPLAAGDFDGDGIQDLVAVTGLGTTEILKGNGNGTFIPGPSLSLGLFSNYTYSTADSVDLNHDGTLDLVIMQQRGQVVVALGNGNGTFGKPTSINTSYFHGLGNGFNYSPLYGNLTAFVADFNHDGNPDIAIFETASGSATAALTENIVAIYTGDGKGNFPASTVAYDANAVSYYYPGPNAAVADFNGDGFADIALDSASGKQLSATIDVLYADKNGNFAAPRTTWARNPSSIVTDDFNRDGNMDVAELETATWPNNPSVLHVFYGSGSGYFQPPQTYTLAAMDGVLTEGDVNGDGIPDLVVTRRYYAQGTAFGGSNDTADLSVLLGRNDGTFAPAKNYVVLGNAVSQSNMPANRSVFLADMNGDKKLDLVGEWGVALGNGDGTFRAPMALPPAAGTELSIISMGLGDFNGDGKPDLAVMSVESADNYPYTGTILTILLGDGTGNFDVGQAIDMTNATAFSSSIVLATDVNGDHIPDLLYIYPGQNGTTDASASLAVRLGKGDGTFGAETDYPVNGDPDSFVYADINHDGIKDIVTGGNGYQGSGGPMTILYGVFNGTFKASTTDVPQATMTDMHAVDLTNRPGIVDVIGITPVGIARMMNSGK